MPFGSIPKYLKKLLKKNYFMLHRTGRVVDLTNNLGGIQVEFSFMEFKLLYSED